MTPHTAFAATTMESPEQPAIRPVAVTVALIAGAWFLGVVMVCGVSAGRDVDELRCELGAIDTCDRVGRLYMTQAQTWDDAARAQRAVRFLDKGCEGGNADACNTLAIAYRRGRGVERDLERAAALFDEACDRGAWVACANLARAQLDGAGVAEDIEAALANYTRACDARERTGCEGLGWMLMRGHGVQMNPERAVSLYARACHDGLARACARLARAVERGEGAERDGERAATLRQRACAIDELFCKDALPM